MDDKTIIQHYWDRDERAIAETDEKYGRFCSSIAENILDSREDASECVNDTYLKTWNALPPHWPKILPAFLGKIVRNLALNRYESNKRQKRGGGQLPLVLDELSDCIPDKSADLTFGQNELSEAVDSFLDTLSARNREIFVMRYWYTESAAYIAKTMKMSENSVFSVLNRTRKKLQKYLEERGFGT